MNKRTTSIIGLLALFIVLMLTGFFVFLLTASLFESRSGVELGGNSDAENFDYQYLEYDPRTNLASSGMVSVLNEIDGYLSYENEEHNHILISEFGAKEYKCTGNCYCDTENERRSTGSVPLTKGLIYLMTAVSTSYALLFAKDHFEETCKDEAGENCVNSEISAEVFDCKLVGGAEEDEKDRLYFCEGNCLRKKYRTKRAKQMAKDYNCEEMKMDGEVVVHPKGLKVVGVEKDQDEAMMQTARYVFQEHYLYDYCFLSSQEEDITDFLENGKKFYVKKMVNMCVAKNKIGINPTIKCRRLDYDFDCDVK